MTLEIEEILKKGGVVMISFEQKNDMIIQITQYSCYGFRHKYSSLTADDLHILYEAESKRVA